MQTIASVQVLRAIAALGVVATHYGLFYTQATGDQSAVALFAFGEAGVDLFFVISGFIMVYASQPLYGQPNAPMTFFSRRVIRIVPIYWAVTTAYLVAAFLLPALQKTYAPGYVAASYFFIPSPLPDGTMHPVVGQGWSLNYEMPFYAIFALALFAPRRMAVIGASAVLTGIVLLGWVFDPAHPVLRFWTYPIILEFVLGMLIGLAYQEGVRLPRALGWAMVAVGLAAFLAAPQMHALTNGGRLLPWGVPAAITIAGATLGGVTASGALWRGLVIVGEASYALYLTHAVAVRGLVAVIRRYEIGFWPGFALALALTIALGLAVYYAFERPVTRALRNFFESKNLKRKSAAAMTA